jgi:hypothetical protein
VWCLFSYHGLCKGRAANNHIFCVQLWNSEYEKLQCHVNCTCSLNKVLSVLQSCSATDNLCMTHTVCIWTVCVHIVGILLCHYATGMVYKSNAVLCELNCSCYHPITLVWVKDTIVYCVHVVGIFCCHMLCIAEHPRWSTGMDLSPITMLQELWLHHLPVVC